MKTILIFLLGLAVGLLVYFGYTQYQKTIQITENNSSLISNFTPLDVNAPDVNKKVVDSNQKNNSISVNSKTVEIKDFDVACPSGWSKSRTKDFGNISVLSCNLLIAGQQAFDDGITTKFFIIPDSEWIKYVGSHFQYALQQKNTVVKDIGLFHGVESYAPGTVGINPEFLGFKKLENGWAVVIAQKVGETIPFNKYEAYLKDILGSFSNM